MGTYSAKPAEVEKKWVMIDAEGLVVGRLASIVAMRLRGKHKPTYTPHVDGGDFVVVVNAKNVRLTGRKLEQKEYVRHSGYAGGLRTTTAGRMLETHPDRVLRQAVKGMLPKGPLGYAMLKKLKCYAGAAHPHTAQQPKTLEI